MEAIARATDAHDLPGSRSRLASDASRQSRRLVRRGGDAAGDLAEAVEALAEHRGEGVEPLRLHGVLHLVVEPVAAEPTFEDGHRERPAPGADHGLQGVDLALLDDRAGEHLAVGLDLAE